jgi:hypothetical protein
MVLALRFIGFVHQLGEHTPHQWPDELVMSVEVPSMHNPVNTRLRKDVQREFMYEQVDDRCRVRFHISMLNSINFKYVIVVAVCSLGSL